MPMRHFALKPLSFVCCMTLLFIPMTGFSSDEPILSPDNPKIVNWEAFDFSKKTNVHRIGVLIETDTLKSASVDWSSDKSRHENRVRVKEAQAEFLANKKNNVLRLFDNFAGIEMLVTDDELRELLKDPRIVTIESETIVEKKLRQGIPQMRASNVRTQFQGSGLTVAILDSGVDYLHPQLGGGAIPNGKVISGVDTSENDSNPIPFGNDAHGTACAGIVAGIIADSGDYIGGVAPMAKIAAVKVFPDGNGSTSSFDVTAGIDWCVTNQNLDPSNPIMVINMSLGGGSFGTVCDASNSFYSSSVNSAVNSGITVLAASGNDGFCSSISAPACISNIISVGALYDGNYGTEGTCVSPATCHPGAETNGGCPENTAIFNNSALNQVTAYSNTATFLDLFAPSGRVATTDISGANGYSTTNFTSDFGGTSAAAPYAAGAVAVLQSASKSIYNRYLTPAEVKSILTSTGYSVTDTKGGGISPGITKPAVDLQAAVDFITQGQELLGSTGLDVSSVINVDPTDRTIVVTKTTSDPINYTITESLPWLTITPTSGTFTGTSLNLNASISVAGLGIGSYSGNITVTANGASNSPYQIPVTLKISPPLGSIIEISEIPVTSDGDANWAEDTSTSVQGGSSLRSGNVSDNEFSELMIEVPDYALNMTFSYQISSELNFDFLVLFTDSQERLRFSGNTTWTERVLDVSSNATFTASYQKDESVSDGQDAAWIDNVDFFGLPASAINNPIPANGAVDIPVDQELQWSKNGNVRQKYDVYLGTAPDQLNLVETNILDQTYSPDLTGGPTFYWQIVSKNGLGMAPSPVFSFTVVNDFAFEGWTFE